MSSLIKSMYNNRILNKEIRKKEVKFNKEIRFTKVLTKYSTEYNNIIFIQQLCSKLCMDKKDLISFFLYLRKDKSVEDIYEMFIAENYDISKLDIARLYRYIDNFYKIV